MSKPGALKIMTHQKINFDSGEIGALGFGLLIVAVIILLFTTNFHIPNSGQHTGYVTSVEQSGIIWKTWTVYIKTDTQSSQEDTYCVTNPSVVSDLQLAATRKSSVTVYYSVPLLTWKWQCGGEQSTVQSINTSSGDVATAQQLSSDTLSSSFICPEDLSVHDLPDVYAKFISDYQKLYPNSTVAQMMTYRFRLLVSHSCNQSLENQLQNVDPVYSPMLRFTGKDFGPQTLEFSSDTKVWTAYYPLGGQGLENPDEIRFRQLHNFDRHPPRPQAGDPSIRLGWIPAYNAPG